MLKKKLARQCESLRETANVFSQPHTTGMATSNYFATPFWKRFYDLEVTLNERIHGLAMPPHITHTYNPVVYAAEVHCDYLRQYLDGPKRLVFVGMNPGPNGMAQTGVPFGNIRTVRDIMGLRGAVEQPVAVHPKRPITGLQCNREEPSGERIWSLLYEVSGNSMDTFARQCFVHNFCPLAFFDKDGKNITPSEIKGEVINNIRDVCLDALDAQLELLQPEIVVAVGGYVFDIIAKKSRHRGTVKVLKLTHPSPRSVNNHNWKETARNFLEENDLCKFARNEKLCSFAAMLENFMSDAFAEARQALAVGEVPVGCVFVYRNEIIARGRNDVNATKNPTRHAEFVCIDQVMEYAELHGVTHRELFAEITVVVTVEPCVMCSAALHQLGVREILYGCANDRFGGKTVVDVGEVVDCSVPIRGNIRDVEAMDLLKEFYKGQNPSAPVAKAKR